MRIVKALALVSILALPLTAMAAPDTKPATQSPTAPTAIAAPAKATPAKATSAKHHVARPGGKAGKRQHKPVTSN